MNTEQLSTPDRCSAAATHRQVRNAFGFNIGKSCVWNSLLKY